MDLASDKCRVLHTPYYDLAFGTFEGGERLTSAGAIKISNRPAAVPRITRVRIDSTTWTAEAKRAACATLGPQVHYGA